MSRKSVSIEYRKSLKVKILETALEMFKRQGFKAVKMDDISKALGISKRTLYEIYSNKEDLIFESFKTNMENNRNILKERLSATSDSMDILIEFFKMRIEECKDANKALLDDMPQYPKIKEFFEANKENHAKQAQEFFYRGQQEGYFLTDVNLTLIREVNSVISEYFISSRLYQKYETKDILRTLMTLFIRSICTTKGIERIDNLLKTL